MFVIIYIFILKQFVNLQYIETLSMCIRIDIIDLLNEYEQILRSIF